MRGVVSFSLLLVAAMFLTGCSAQGTGEFAVPAGQYADAFQAARGVLRDHRFEVERVDAEEGVLTTRPKASSGWASPWDTEQTTAVQESSDLFNQQRRRVRVTFEPARAAPGEARTGRVVVAIDRVQSTGVRLNPRSVQLTTVSVDPALSARGVWTQYDVPVERDAAFEARLARAIEKALGPARP